MEVRRFAGTLLGCFILAGLAIAGAQSPAAPTRVVEFTATIQSTAAVKGGFDFALGGLKRIHRAWFFELTDGTTCTPLTVRGRELDGLNELYKCKWGSSGEADAVLGDLDDSQPIWTIRKVSINKKTEPQTIKSMTIATVKTVWR